MQSAKLNQQNLSDAATSLASFCAESTLNINDLPTLYELTSCTSTCAEKLIQGIEESSITIGTAMFKCINALVTDELFTLQVWDGGYGSHNGIWIALGSEDKQIDYFRDMLTSPTGDDFIDIATNLVLSTNWLPYVFDRTMVGAMVKLESRIASLPSEERIRESDWADMLICAVNDLKAQHMAFRDNKKLDTQTVLGNQFSESLRIITERYGPWPRDNALIKVAKQIGPYIPFEN